MLDETIPSLSEPYVYNAELVRVVDGDTVRFRLWKHFEYELDFGFYIKEQISSTKSTEMNFRLYGIDTPEIRGVPIEEKKKGLEAKSRVEEILSWGEIRVRTLVPDKYGRWLAEIWISGADQTAFSLNKRLIEEGYAKPYLP